MIQVKGTKRGRRPKITLVEKVKNDMHNSAPPKKKEKEKKGYEENYSCDNPTGSLHNTLAGVGSSLSFPRKSADSQTGPTTSKVEVSASGGAGETNSMCCNQVPTSQL